MSSEIKRLLKFLIVILFVLGFVAGISVKAADTASVTATVTAQNISVTVTDGTVAYGTISLSSSKDTTTSGTNDSQTATNNGNVTENFNIKGQDSANWTLAATAGPDQYVLHFVPATAILLPRGLL